jgi:hypothetical protein
VQQVTAGGSLRATLVWTDAAGSAAAGILVKSFVVEIVVRRSSSIVNTYFANR